MAALAAQKFIHPQEHIYQLKWVSKDRSLELIYRYTSRHRDTCFNDIILIGQAFLLLQPRSEYFYFVSQKGSFALHAFILRNRVSWQHCQEHIIFATEATLGELFASLVLNGVYKCFCSHHIEDLSQTVLCRCAEKGAQLCPSLSQGSRQRCWAACACQHQSRPAQLHFQQDKGACLQHFMHCHHRGHFETGSGEGGKMLYLGIMFFSTAPGNHKPQADHVSASQAVDNAVHQLSSKSQS